MSISAARCSYFGCGRSRKRNPDIRRFAFPVNDSTRCAIWIKNSGTSELATFEPAKLKKYFLCEKHFRKQDFLTSKLTVCAIPIPYMSKDTREERDPERKIYTNTKPIIVSTSDGSDPISSYTVPSISPNNSTSNIALRMQLLKVKQQLKRAKNALKTQKKIAFNSSRLLQKLPLFVGSIMKNNTRFLVKNHAALIVYYKSPNTYNFLRNKGLNLPDISKLFDWLNECLR